MNPSRGGHAGTARGTTLRTYRARGEIDAASVARVTSERATERTRIRPMEATRRSAYGCSGHPLKLAKRPSDNVAGRVSQSTN
jgi:hypothetical protein